VPAAVSAWTTKLLHIPGTKTDSAVRKVKIRGALREELLAIKGENDADAFVFENLASKKMEDGKDWARTRAR
jgi:hypothetical protein